MGAPKPLTCQQCGKTFQAQRSDAKTCSDRCRARRSRRMRDPATGSPERRARQRAGLDSKYAYRQREQASRDLRKLGLIVSDEESTHHGHVSVDRRVAGVATWAMFNPVYLQLRQARRLFGRVSIADGEARITSVPGSVEQIERRYDVGLMRRASQFDCRRCGSSVSTKSLEAHQDKCDGTYIREGRMRAVAPSIAERITRLEVKLSENVELTRLIAEQLGLAVDDERVREAVETFLRNTLD
jgi:hypothetical protein